MKRIKIAVIGGGAAGLVAAIAAAGEGAQVTIYEAKERLGSKILATGNGRCNLGNTYLTPDCFYCADKSFLADILNRFDTKASLDFFASLGVFTREKNGYLYPAGMQASLVLDALRWEVEALGILVHTGHPVASIKPCKGGFSVEGMLFDKVILALGSPAGTAMKAAGKAPLDALAIPKALGLQVQPFFPALVPVLCKEAYCKALAGVRAIGEVSVYEKDVLLAREAGEIQFTENGLSGIPIFQCSRVINAALEKEKSLQAFVNLLPELDEAAFRALLKKRKMQEKAHRTIEAYLSGLVHKKLLLLACKLAGVSPAAPAMSLSEEQEDRVFALLRALPFTVIGSKGIAQAQVCAGGVALEEVTRDFAVKSMPGLYIVGEMLDVDGICGGYNLHWAWAGGFLAGSAAGKA